MNPIKLFFRFAIVASVLSSLYSHSAPGESIVLDPKSGNYVITYIGIDEDDNQVMRRVEFVPANKFDLTIDSSFKWGQQQEIIYRYAMKNDAHSKESMVTVAFDPVSNIKSDMSFPKQLQDRDRSKIREYIKKGQSALTTPAAWNGSVNVSAHATGLRIGWRYHHVETNSDGLQPGKTQSGFGFISQDLPGISIADARGYTPINGFPDEGPDGEIGNQLDKIMENNFIVRSVAVPMISLPSPFNLLELLRQIQTHVQTWPSMKLVDPTLSSQLDRLFQAAIDAATRNNTRGTHTALKDIQHLLKKEHPDMDSEDDHDEGKGNNRTLIDRLAARVLDFDITYVLKRVGGDK